MATARKKAAPTTDQTGDAKPGLRILKKYPNRRLYDTQTSSYITLADVKRMVLDGVDFEVHDAKTQEDLTRSILLQIILEEETGGVPMFSTSSLAQIIRFYGHAMQGVMGGLLERQMQAFTDMQQRFTEQTPGMPFTPEAWTGLMGGYAEQSKNLMNQWQEQLKNAGVMFPFGPKK
ncbi:polyhydroxyalkanoate synthesis repressor PhaR [Roseateles puraquae]|jgi:polyhydroxyalkanoate synthesis repressor PhaR|uniref:Polyhydroxyalkanoate synthesis repressor PhaR n=1 Tax=Roseateles puraquae TaxID=431059 RepID=A0A254NCX1_9BURK|nr:polyhydroxyalkanoate synthesis repressor PhaR [Roseateles puraquae]MDG0852379.1 polyhydroxyalkanoate synthesis repressor PhaR [Roseateles puraquae]OWR04227.1 polyhydroxyalkanoate synthesis repressor PhaR [Roseateles puraquae]